MVITRDAAARRAHADAALLYRLRNPEKVSAREAVKKALRGGVLARPIRCGHCGVDCKPEASHTDYARPLDVEWLCRPCHEEKDLSTHCKNGHEMTPENSHWVEAPDGRRRKCRACARKWTADYRARRKADACQTEPKMCRFRRHQMTPENTAVCRRRDGSSYQRCRECARVARRAFALRQKGGESN